MYLYYPGCSLKGTGRAYEESLLEVFRAMEIPMVELEDWNCCGATAYMSIDEMKAFGLAARNLALAEQQNDGEMVDLVAPCSACYLVLTKVKEYMSEYSNIGKQIEGALNAANLRFRGHVRVRHPLDILLNDFGVEKILEHVTNRLDGVRAACYYGCQLVRPYAAFDDQYNPTSMDTILSTVGVETIEWPLKTHCCGGSLTGTMQNVGLRLNYILLREAKKRGAEVVVTACPLCQFNLECYQDRIATSFGEKVDVSVAYFTQMIGLSFGVPEKKLGIKRLFNPPTFTSVSSEGGQNARV